MLNFRNTNIFFSVLLFVAIASHMMGEMSFYVYPVLLVLYLSIIVYGCCYINSGFFLKVLCASQTDKKEIAITFDDGPAGKYTPDILKVLKAAEIKAAFFCIGRQINGNEKLLQQLLSEGHLVGNHSHSHHFWFDMFSSTKMLRDLQQMDEAFQKVSGLQPKLFRPPYGVTNPNLKNAIKKGKYIPVGWSVRSLDTVIKDEVKLLRKLRNGLQPGAVFLFHDTSISALKTLPSFIEEVKKQGYHIVPLDKLLNLQPYA